jgi:uncharacterized membrane protein (UPF0136 family)
MLTMLGKFSMLALSFFIGAGGVMGYVKAKSKASLIAGLISAALLDVAFAVSMANTETGLYVGTGVSLALCVVFAMRFKKTGKFMPSGMLLGLCIVEAALLMTIVRILPSLPVQ